jgi:hypothetical protein
VFVFTENANVLHKNSKNLALLKVKRKTSPKAMPFQARPDAPFWILAHRLLPLFGKNFCDSVDLTGVYLQGLGHLCV